MVHSLLFVVSTALWLMELAVIARVIGGWIGADPNKPFMKTLHAVTEPLFQLVRPIARKIPGPIDWTPVIVVVGLWLLRQIF
jgi:YggT family protein